MYQKQRYSSLCAFRDSLKFGDKALDALFPAPNEVPWIDGTFVLIEDQHTIYFFFLDVVAVFKGAFNFKAKLMEQENGLPRTQRVRVEAVDCSLSSDQRSVGKHLFVAGTEVAPYICYLIGMNARQGSNRSASFFDVFSFDFLGILNLPKRDANKRQYGGNRTSCLNPSWPFVGIWSGQPVNEQGAYYERHVAGYVSESLKRCHTGVTAQPWASVEVVNEHERSS